MWQNIIKTFLPCKSEKRWLWKHYFSCLVNRCGLLNEVIRIKKNNSNNLKTCMINKGNEIINIGLSILIFVKIFDIRLIQIF